MPLTEKEKFSKVSRNNNKP